jgi:hypothetical protein
LTKGALEEDALHQHCGVPPVFCPERSLSAKGAEPCPTMPCLARFCRYPSPSGRRPSSKALARPNGSLAGPPPSISITFTGRIGSCQSTTGPVANVPQGSGEEQALQTLATIKASAQSIHLFAESWVGTQRELPETYVLDTTKIMKATPRPGPSPLSHPSAGQGHRGRRARPVPDYGPLLDRHQRGRQGGAVGRGQPGLGASQPRLEGFVPYHCLALRVPPGVSNWFFF